MPTLTFKVSLDEARRIRALAKQKKTTLSDYVRTSVLREPKSRGKTRIITDPISGFPVLKAPDGTPPLTSEQVRAMLADFP